MMNRQIAEKNLKEIFKLDHFYDDQWKTIERIFNGDRMLLIEKTGFGKSLCYQFPATQLESLTIIFSPLIALMRDQIKYLKSLGISTECINSEQTYEENTEILNRARHGKIKILYIAPERQENSEWLEAIKDIVISMVVIDEAHCISTWGHNFRPAFRRIVNLIQTLPQNFPVLATTATATNRVANDIKTQINVNDLSTIKGKLVRKNFELKVVNVFNEESKMCWIKNFIEKEKGNGLVYTGTRTDTDKYASWLQFNDIKAANYNAGLDTESRIEIEKGLMSNKWKCIVSTNALGMGIDKPDIRYIIHTQLTQSPIHYYQEIGRAGRDGLPTKIILLYNEQDKDLPEHFIKNSKPSEKKYLMVINTLKEEALGEWQIMRSTNLNQTQIRVILADLIDQKIITEAMYGRSKKYEYVYNAPKLNPKSFEELKSFQMNELNEMITYCTSSTCRMDYLCRYLGDKTSGLCGLCDNCNNENIQFQPSSNCQKKIEDFRNIFFPQLKVETKKSNIVNGVAASYYGVTNIGSTIHRCKYEKGGDFPSHLLKQTLRAFRSKFGSEKFDILLYVPSTVSGDLVKNFAVKIGKTLNIHVSHDLSKNRNTVAQKKFKNFLLKRDNVKDAFIYIDEDEIYDKKIILFDDIYDSGATIKEIGLYLTSLGAKEIAPLVIAKTVGGDIK